MTGQIGQSSDASGANMIKRASVTMQEGSTVGGAGEMQVSGATVQLVTSGGGGGQLQATATTGDDKAEGRQPLFLRNVVGQQFKYRWLVLAISAFTCMTIIVVVSVVYSNR